MLSRGSRNIHVVTQNGAVSVAIPNGPKRKFMAPCTITVTIIPKIAHNAERMFGL